MAIHKLPSGNWQADSRYKDANGLYVRVRGSGPTKKKAVEDLEAKIKIRKSKERKPTVTPPNDLRTIDDLWTHYITRRRYSELTKSSIHAYEAHWKSFRQWCELGSFRYLEQLVPSDLNQAIANIEQFYSYLLKKNTVVTANTKMIIVSMVLDAEIKRPDRHIAYNPCSALETAKQDESEIRWLTPNELACLWSLASLHERHLFGLLLHSGMRPGEATNLTKEQLRTMTVVNEQGDLEVRKVIAIVPHDGWRPKHGKIRYIPINEEADAHLNYFLELNADRKYLISGTNRKRDFKKPAWSGMLNNAYQNLSQKAMLEYNGLDLSDTTVYALRRTFGSLLAEAGFPYSYISVVMGHSSEHTTRKHYARIRPERTVDVVNALNHFNNDYFQNVLKNMDTSGGHPKHEFLKNSTD